MSIGVLNVFVIDGEPSLPQLVNGSGFASQNWLEIAVCWLGCLWLLGLAGADDAGELRVGVSLGDETEAYEDDYRD